MINSEQQGNPSKIVHAQIKAIANNSNPAELLRLTLLTTLQQSLKGYQREDTELDERKEPAVKKVKWTKGKPSTTYRRSFLSCI